MKVFVCFQNPQSAVNLVERRYGQQNKKNDECDSLNIETLARQVAQTFSLCLAK